MWYLAQEYEIYIQEYTKGNCTSSHGEAAHTGLAFLLETTRKLNKLRNNYFQTLHTQHPDCCGF